MNDGFLKDFHYKPDGSVARDEALLACIKSMIADGRLKPGEQMPTIKELAEAAGLTFRQARSVMERLAEERFVRSRPRVGSVVLPRVTRINRGRVVLAIPDVDASSYHATQIADVLRKRFASSGFSLATVVFSQDARRRLGFLASELADPPALAIVMYSRPHVRSFLREAGARCIYLYGDEPAADEGAWIRFSADAAIERFVAHCRHTGVKNVTQVRFDGNETPDAGPALAAAGISSRWMVMPRWDVLGRFEGIKRPTYDAFMEMPADNLPDLFLFWDDFVAQGALTAFLNRGIRLPGDTKVVTLSNRGLGPVYTEPLTRFECDAAATGEIVAEYALAVLSKSRVPAPPVVSPQYIFGATFPY